VYKGFHLFSNLKVSKTGYGKPLFSFFNSSEQHRNEKTGWAGLPAKDCIFISGWAERPSSLRHMTRKRHIAFEEGGLWPAVLKVITLSSAPQSDPGSPPS
ncbi:MAG: hypothetical protein LIP11_14495, partial [Clostridiales bacterium]|nr:hypothetical protein [Clostridiales bacterium]